MYSSTVRPLAIAALAIGLVSCQPAPTTGQEQLGEDKPEPKLAAFLDRQLGNKEAPVRVVTFLPVTNACQDVIGEYLARVAREFPNVYQVRILAMKSPEAKEIMRANGIRCAAVMVNGKTTFDTGGEDGKFILEGVMDPRDVARALAAAGREAAGDKAPDLPKPPIMPNIESIPKKRVP